MGLSILTYQEEHKLPPTAYSWLCLQLKFLCQMSRIWEKYVMGPSPPAVERRVVTGTSEEGKHISGGGKQPASDGAGRCAQKPQPEILGAFP